MSFEFKVFFWLFTARIDENTLYFLRVHYAQLLSPCAHMSSEFLFWFAVHRSLQTGFIFVNTCSVH